MKQFTCVKVNTITKLDLLNLLTTEFTLKNKQKGTKNKFNKILLKNVN